MRHDISASVSTRCALKDQPESNYRQRTFTKPIYYLSEYEIWSEPRSPMHPSTCLIVASIGNVQERGAHMNHRLRNHSQSSLKFELIVVTSFNRDVSTCNESHRVEASQTTTSKKVVGLRLFALSAV